MRGWLETRSKNAGETRDDDCRRDAAGTKRARQAANG